MATAIRETDHPQWREWYVRYALLDDRVLVLGDHKLAHNGHFEDWWKRYEVVSSRYIAGQVFKCQCGCGNTDQHRVDPQATVVHFRSNSLTEAEAAYAEVERKLLAGDLTDSRKGER